MSKHNQIINLCNAGFAPIVILLFHVMRYILKKIDIKIQINITYYRLPDGY
jgi:hypothetical protein